MHALFTHYSLLWRRVAFGEEASSVFGNEIPCIHDVVVRGANGAHDKADDEASLEHSVHHVQLGTAVDRVEESAVKIVGTLYAETHEPESGRRWQLKAVVLADERLEDRGQAHVLANVALHSLDTVCPHHKPQLERAEPPSQGNLPVAVVSDESRLRGGVFQVLRVDGEALHEGIAVLDPQSGAVEIDKKTLVGIEVERIGKLHAHGGVAVLWAYKGASRIRSIHVKPELVGAANSSHRGNVIHGARIRRAECCADEERNESLRNILAHGSLEKLSRHAEVCVCLDRVKTNTGNQTGLFHGRVHLIRRICHEATDASTHICVGSLATIASAACVRAASMVTSTASLAVP
eukprot:Opistho-2@68940